MPDYQNSKIYKLVSNKTSDIYIGSCLMRLSTRLSNHKSLSNTTISKKLFINEAIITIILIENFPCNTKNELKARELHHITTNNCININKPFICDIPYSDRNAYMKEYYHANTEQISISQKKYYDANKEQISAYKKEYQQANSDKHNSRQKKYDDSHKEQRRARYAEKKLALKLENTLNNNIIA